MMDDVILKRVKDHWWSFYSWNFLSDLLGLLGNSRCFTLFIGIFSSFLWFLCSLWLLYTWFGLDFNFLLLLFLFQDLLIIDLLNLPLFPGLISQKLTIFDSRGSGEAKTVSKLIDIDLICSEYLLHHIAPEVIEITSVGVETSPVEIVTFLHEFS